MSLLAPIERVAGFDTVMPLPRLEQHYLPERGAYRRGRRRVPWLTHEQLRPARSRRRPAGGRDRRLACRRGRSCRRRPAAGLGRDREGGGRGAVAAIRADRAACSPSRAIASRSARPWSNSRKARIADTGTVVGELPEPRRPRPRRRRGAAKRALPRRRAGLGARARRRSRQRDRHRSRTARSRAPMSSARRRPSGGRRRRAAQRRAPQHGRQHGARPRRGRAGDGLGRGRYRGVVVAEADVTLRLVRAIAGGLRRGAGAQARYDGKRMSREIAGSSRSRHRRRYRGRADRSGPARYRHGVTLDRCCGADLTRSRRRPARARVALADLRDPTITLVEFRHVRPAVMPRWSSCRRRSRSSAPAASAPQAVPQDGKHRVPAHAAAVAHLRSSRGHRRRGGALSCAP